MKSTNKILGLESRIKAEASRLGFSHFGITNPDPPQNFQLFSDWLEKEYHGDMKYLGRKDTMIKRANPKQLLEGCRSIICLGMNFPSSKKDDEDPFRICSYAQGKDYHLVIPPRVEKLASFISSNVHREIHYTICTDSAPILERELAQRSGLGWIGRNSCLISPTQGSYFFLAELFLDYPLDPSPAFDSDLCGSCRNCVDACPTVCIQSDRTIDARRCISYLTIEKKDIIPEDLRKILGEWIFGCDICQQVCPWNKKLNNRPVDVEFSKMDLTRELSLEFLSELDPGEFKKFFRNSPILRTKRIGLMRNILIAIGNKKMEEAIPFVSGIIQSEKDPVLQSTALWTMSRLTNDQINK